MKGQRESLVRLLEVGLQADDVPQSHNVFMLERQISRKSLDTPTGTPSSNALSVNEDRPELWTYIRCLLLAGVWLTLLQVKIVAAKAAAQLLVLVASRPCIQRFHAAKRRSSVQIHVQAYLVTSGQHAATGSKRKASAV